MKITAHKDTTLLQLLIETFPESSTTKIKKIIQCGTISYKGASVKHLELVIKKGESVEYQKYKAKYTYKERSEIPILFEDQYIIATFKPNGVPVEGKSVQGMRSLLNSVTSYYQQKKKGAVYLVNSIEWDEGGICIFAKDMETLKRMKAALPNYQFISQAIIEGAFPHKTIEYNYPILVLDNSKTIIADKETEDTIKAITKVKLLTQYEDFSLVEIESKTNHRFQTRLHLSHANFPIVGDKRFGNKEIKTSLRLFNHEIRFVHPYHGKRIVITTSIPKSFVLGLKPRTEKTIESR